MVIDEALRARINAETARFPEQHGGLLGALHLVQEELGCVPLEAARELAEIFEVFPVEIQERVRFYHLFHDAPRGRHLVNVCTSLPCALRGSNLLLRQLEVHLGVRVGETTADGRIHLGREECLGACANAPMIRIGSRNHDDLGFEDARDILDALE